MGRLHIITSYKRSVAPTGLGRNYPTHPPVPGRYVFSHSTSREVRRYWPALTTDLVVTLGELEGVFRYVTTNFGAGGRAFYREDHPVENHQRTTLFCNYLSSSRQPLWYYEQPSIVAVPDHGLIVTLISG